MRFFAATTVLAFPALIAASAADKPNHKRHLTSLVTDTAKSAIKSVRSRSLLSDSDMDMTGMGGMICSFMEGAMDDPSVQDEMEGLECECESTDTELTLGCDVTEKICDVEYGCIDAGSFEVTMPLDMNGDVTYEVCMTYTNDPETPSFAQGKEFCFDAVANLDFTTMMDNPEEGVTLKSCKATFGDPLQPNDCGCEVCGSGLGVKVDCGNEIKSECTDFMDDGSSGSEGAALPGSSGIPVMKLQEETATATDSTGEEKTATTDPDSTSGGSYASAPIVASAAGLTMVISALM